MERKLTLWRMVSNISAFLHLISKVLIHEKGEHVAQGDGEGGMCRRRRGGPREARARGVVDLPPCSLRELSTVMSSRATGEEPSPDAHNRPYNPS